MNGTIAPSVSDFSLCVPDLKPRRRESVLEDLVERARAAGTIREAALLLETLCMRERLGTTAIGKGVAVPNVRSIAVIDTRLVVARSRRGVEWKAEDGQPAQLVFLVLSSGEHSIEVHHEFLGRAVAFARLQRNRQKLLEAPTAAAMATLLREVAP